MFELEHAIVNWRTSLTESCSNADIDELETHLRDEIEQLTPAGLTAEEAFIIATRRLGDAQSLTHEFQKVNGGSVFTRRLFWMISGCLAFILISSGAAAVAQLCVTFAGYAGLRGVSLAVVSLFAKLLAMAIGFVLLYLLTRAHESVFRSGSFISYTPGKIAVIVVVIFASIIFTAAHALLPALTARMISVSEYGQMAMAMAYIGLVWPILIPAALAIILVTLRIPGRPDLKFN